MNKQSVLTGDIGIFETKEGFLKLKVMNLLQEEATNIALTLEDWGFLFGPHFKIKQTQDVFRVVISHNAVCDMIESGRIICNAQKLQRAKEIIKEAAKKDLNLPPPYIATELDDGTEIKLALTDNLDFPHPKL